MHVVIDELCTGCELCVPVCPVDCIAMIGASGDRTGWDAWDAAHADQARDRYARHAARLGPGAETAADTKAAPPARQETIAAVLARAREARASR
jgi:electron transport complex protein RnfB